MIVVFVWLSKILFHPTPGILNSTILVLLCHNKTKQAVSLDLHWHVMKHTGVLKKIYGFSTDSKTNKVWDLWHTI